jgi:hypothetical protein
MYKMNTSVLLFPFLAVLVIAVYAGGLGIVFMLLYDTEAHEWAVIGLGAALVVGVPAVAALGQRMVEKG